MLAVCSFLSMQFAKYLLYRLSIAAQVIGPSTSTPTKPSASRIPRPTDHASFGGKVRLLSSDHAKIRLLSSAPSLFQPSAVVSSTESHNQQQPQARQRQRQQQPQAFRAKLQLVDLAGSECVGMSGATGNTLRETQCINKRCAFVKCRRNSLLKLCDKAKGSQAGV